MDNNQRPSWIARLGRGLERLRQSEDQLSLVLSLVVGALVGLVVVAFILLTGRLAARLYPAGESGWRRILVPGVRSRVGLCVVGFFLLAGPAAARIYPARGSGWRRILVPVLGSLITGYLLWRYFPFARGSGIPQTRFALFIDDGRIQIGRA